MQDNINEFMNQPENSGDVEKVLKKLDQLYAKYRFMECTLDAKRIRLLRQIPDLERSLEMIENFKSQQQELEFHFQLSDQVLTKVNFNDNIYITIFDYLLKLHFDYTTLSSDEINGKGSHLQHS